MHLCHSSSSDDASEQRDAELATRVSAAPTAAMDGLSWHAAREVDDASTFAASFAISASTTGSRMDLFFVVAMALVLILACTSPVDETRFMTTG